LAAVATTAPCFGGLPPLAKLSEPVIIVGAMNITHTTAGTPVVDLTDEEYAAYLERQVQREIGMSVAEFTRAYTAGELEDGDVAVDELVGKLRIGQNGHKAAA
jgi:hypothetical protein